MLGFKALTHELGGGCKLQAHKLQCLWGIGKTSVLADDFNPKKEHNDTLIEKFSPLWHYLR